MGVITWPTPDAAVSNDGEDLASWEARRQAVLATGVNGNGMGTPLAIAVRQKWPTPRATDGEKGSTSNRGERSTSGTGESLPTTVGNGCTNSSSSAGESSDTSATPQQRRAPENWPTMVASMETMQDMEQQRFSGSDARRPGYRETESRGLLNPRWVEALMGWPLGFLGLPPEVLGPLVAALRKRRGSRREPAGESRSGGNS